MKTYRHLKLQGRIWCMRQTATTYLFMHC